MARFGLSDPNETPPRPAMDEIRTSNGLPPVITPVVAPVITPPSPIITPPPSLAINAPATSNAQSAVAVGLAQSEIDSKIVDDAITKQQEHWVKSYWRPAMGWLYMAMCAFDFIIFPMITLFLPIIEHGFGITMPYSEWKSLTLSNGGLIHVSFGAILGVAAWTRGQEKMIGRN